MNAEAFVHLPALRERIKAPHLSELRVTPEVLADWDQRNRGLGHPENWRLPDAQREASRRATLQQRPSTRDVWVFGYGSLMWDPGFHFTEVRLADVDGHQRRFTNKMTIGRGTLEHPALMLTLEPQAGRCQGLAFRVTAETVEAETTILWRREMLRGSYTAGWLPALTPQGPIDVLAFLANPDCPSYTGEQPLAQTASVIASAVGSRGSNRDYLEQLAAQLDLLVIEDAYIRRLMAEVQALANA